MYNWSCGKKALESPAACCGDLYFYMDVDEIRNLLEMELWESICFIGTDLSYAFDVRLGCTYNKN